MPFDVRVISGKDAFHVPALVRLDDLLDKLHVLLRHRLRPQPAGFEGFLSISPVSRAGSDRWMKVGPDAGARGQPMTSLGQPVRVASRSACLARTRHERLKPLAH